MSGLTGAAAMKYMLNKKAEEEADALQEKEDEAVARKLGTKLPPVGEEKKEREGGDKKEEDASKPKTPDAHANKSLRSNRGSMLVIKKEEVRRPVLDASVVSADRFFRKVSAANSLVAGTQAQNVPIQKGGDCEREKSRSGS